MPTSEPRSVWIGAAFLVALGLARMGADLAGLPLLGGIAAATNASPTPKVFSSSKGLETYSIRFFLEWSDRRGAAQVLELTPEVYARIRGPYNRRNVYGAALAYGPVLASSETTRPQFEAVTRHALTGEAPLLRELGLDPGDMPNGITVRCEPLPGTQMGDLPRVFTFR